MKSIGIVCEYNPFHNGHIYQINKIKEKYKDYTIIAVMSGHFMQRGDISIIDKWKRTEIALKNGIDLVIELPFPFATQSADFFANGALTILEELKVEKIIFGSESDNIEDLKLIAKTQIDNPIFDKLVNYYSKAGYNYPTALSKALEEITKKKIDNPNDLLGISYIKSIYKNNYKIIPESIKRTNNYHDKTITSSISSATSIRNAIKEKISIDNQIPENEKEYLNNYHFIEEFFELLKYKIITEKDLSIYQTVDEGIGPLIKKNIDKTNSLEELINLTKSKRYTYNKIKRMMIHILCNFTKEKANKMNKITYIRILGLNNKGRSYLNKIKKEVTIPIISKITREKDDMLSYEIETTKIVDIIFKSNLVKREFNSIIYLGDEKYDKE